ncbi:cysteine-rich receptor-like protein kinase, partial [Tanacetum coccineum]
MLVAPSTRVIEQRCGGQEDRTPLLGQGAEPLAGVSFPELSEGCNASFVTLIPKVVDSMGLGDFWPISLVGSYYKIIAKLLAERVKKIVGDVIGEPQNAFIKGHFILDGVLIANETMEYLEKKKRKRLIFKVDFEKAYDSIDWGYLLQIMKQMGFGDR